MVSSRALFTLAVGAVAAQRLLETRVSARNEAALRAQGAREHASGQYVQMRLLHGSWLVAMLAEVWFFDRVFDARVAAVAASVFVVGQLLRAAAMHALGPRWTVKIITVPGESAVRRGVFAWIRHPNYLGVCLEIAALPLVHGAWITAVVYSVWNAWLLRSRIRAEEKALTLDAGYDAVMAGRPRFLPQWWSR
ncbi:isoprenylcysteine carboxyl methyltransferase family protein [soil metagenome]